MIDLIRRQIELLKLLEKQSGYKPASFLSKALDVSTKTIYSDISFIQTEAKKYSVELIRSPRLGIRLEGEKEDIRRMIREISNDEFDAEIKFSPEYRRLWILKKVLVDCENITLDFLSKKFIISKTSLYQDILVINRMINATDDMELKVGENGLVIQAKESDIQNALKNFMLVGKEDTFTEFIHKLNQLFPSKVVKAVSDLIMEDFSELTEEISEYYLKSLLATVIIQTSRLQQNFHMEMEETISYNNIQHMETFIVANSMAEQLKHDLQVHYNNDDMEYLCRQLFAHRVTNHMKNTANEYEEVAKQVIERMSDIQKLDLTQDETLYRALLYHLPPMILRLRKKIHIVNPLLDSIKEEYPELFAVLWYALSIIESKYQVTLTDDEVSLILLHFQVALDNFAEVGNIIVVCTYGVSTSQLILGKVKQLLPARDKITVMNLKKLSMTDLTNVDLVISPIDIEDISVPYVKVHPLLTKEDYTNILDAYTKQVLLIKNNGYGKETNKIEAPTLKKYLNSKFIFLKMRMKNKQECLDYIIQVLEDSQDVEKEFRDSIYNREKMGVTCMDTGVALPHADPKTIRNARVVILTLVEPVDWGGIQVKLIITTAFPEKDMDQIRDVISELYQLIEKKEDVDDFVQIDSVEKMIEKFY